MIFAKVILVRLLPSHHWLHVARLHMTNRRSERTGWEGEWPQTATFLVYYRVQRFSPSGGGCAAAADGLKRREVSSIRVQPPTA